MSGDVYNLLPCITQQWMTAPVNDGSWTTYEPLQWQQDPDKVKDWVLMTPPDPLRFKRRGRASVSNYHSTAGQWITISTSNFMSTNVFYGSSFPMTSRRPVRYQ